MMCNSVRIAFVAFLALASISAYADENFPTFSLHGSARARAEGNDFTDYTSARDFFSIRLRPDLLIRADSKIDLFFEPQAVKVWGQSYITPTQTYSTSISSTGAGSYGDNAVGIHQAYIDWHPFKGLNFIIGRQLITYGDELVFGTADWNIIGRAWDAGRVRYSYDLGQVDFFYSKVNEGNYLANSTSKTTPYTASGDKDVYAFYNSMDLGAGVHAADVYGLYQQDASVSPASRLEAFGVRLKSNLNSVSDVLSPFDYRIEATKEFGNSVAYGSNAYQFDGEIGYTLATTPLKPRLSLEAAISGKNYNQLYPSPHKWLGFADLFGRRNIQDYVVHLSTEITEKTGAQLDFHKLYRNSTDAAVFKTDGTTELGSASSTSAQDVASEWDLTFRQAVSATTNIVAGASLIQSGDFLKASYGDINPKFYYVLLETKF